MKSFSKNDLIAELRAIGERGWIRSARGRNNGAVGNTLEDLLGIEENNLPIPNASDWELKAQRIGTTSNITLTHSEPSPRAMRLVPQYLLPEYGWPHREAGVQYHDNEMSFRLSLSCNRRTDRGFTYLIDDEEKKIVVTFEPSRVDARHAVWADSLKLRGSFQELTTAPYWGFDDLAAKLRDKLHNCFLVEAERRRLDGKEEFFYRRVTKLESFDFQNFLNVALDGGIIIDFDARTGHNHGTKFRIPALRLPELYATAEVVINL